VTIVGVVGDIKSDGFDLASVPCIYVSESQVPPYGAVVYLRTAGDPGVLGEAIRREVQAVDPAVPVFGIRTMDDVVAKNPAARRFALELLGVFIAIAFLLASIGIYGVMAYTFSRRIGEIGLRRADWLRDVDAIPADDALRHRTHGPDHLWRPHDASRRRGAVGVSDSRSEGGQS